VRCPSARRPPSPTPRCQRRRRSRSHRQRPTSPQNTPTTKINTASTAAPDNNNGLTEGLLPTSGGAPENGAGAGPSSSAAAANQQRPYYAAGAAFLSRNSFRHGELRHTLSTRAGAAAAASSSFEAAAAAALAAHDEERAPPGDGAVVHGGSPHAHAKSPSELSLRTDCLALKEIVFGSWLNLLLICVPLGVLAEPLGWGATATFGLNFFALVPLALILGDITEDLAVRFGDTVGGLINATFGNVVEIILSVAALQQGLYQVGF
jgi:hypothetical protein